MENFIYPCIILKGKVAEATDFYINTFGDAKILQSNPVVTQLLLSDQKFMLLNDGPDTTPNASISFMVNSEYASTTEQYYHALVEGGKIMMGLDAYPWSPKYAWVQDKYGVSWQLYTGNAAPQKFSPTLMFSDGKAGKTIDAVHYYTKLFPQSNIQGILHYSKEDGTNTDFVKHSQFAIRDFVMMAMDSPMDHGFTFNDAISFVVECKTQAEIDKYWNELTTNGGKEIQCGWLVDKYGVSWQIIPENIGGLLFNPAKGDRAFNAMMKMKKLVIADLENA